MPSCLRALALFPLFAALTPVCAAQAQTAPVGSAPPSPATAQEPADYTLHIYTTLFQVPTLVLPQNPNFPITTRLTAPSFTIALDGGPPFQPATARREDADPIDLAILLDTSGRENRLLKSFAASLQLAATASLRPQDIVSIYALDCHLIATAPISGNNPAFGAAVTSILDNPDLHNNRGRSACERTLTLRDSTAFMAGRFSSRPSRRVLLLLTEGIDGKSNLKYDAMLSYIRSKGVAVFGMRDGPIHDAYRDVEAHLRSIGMLPAGESLDDLANSSGGTVYSTTPENLATSLQQFITDLRGRYILEFEAPSDPRAGQHIISIRIAHDIGIAHPAPLTAAMPDASLATDPTVLHTSGANAPKYGDQKAKPQH